MVATHQETQPQANIRVLLFVGADFRQRTSTEEKAPQAIRKTPTNVRYTRWYVRTVRQSSQHTARAAPVARQLSPCPNFFQSYTLRNYIIVVVGTERCRMTHEITKVVTVFFHAMNFFGYCELMVQHHRLTTIASIPAYKAEFYYHYCPARVYYLCSPLLCSRGYSHSCQYCNTTL